MKFWTLELVGFIWALPVTILGLLVTFLCGGSDIYHHKGLRLWIMVDNMWFLRKRFNAMCLGAFVFVRKERFNTDPDKWSYWQIQLYKHEDEHRRQCWILGPFVIPLYILFTLLAWTLYRKYYRANWLEIMARWKAGQGLDP